MTESDGVREKKEERAVINTDCLKNKDRVQGYIQYSADQNLSYPAQKISNETGSNVTGSFDLSASSYPSGNIRKSSTFQEKKIKNGYITKLKNVNTAINKKYQEK